MDPQTIAKVALPVPLRHTFDFIVPPALGRPHIGGRVRVPFGRRRLIGMVVKLTDSSAIPQHRLRCVDDILDPAPIYSETMLQWLQWVADYYHHPLGEVVFTALPVALRRGLSTDPKQIRHYKLTLSGRSANPEFKRAPLQKSIWLALHAQPTLSPSRLAELGKSWQRSIGPMIDNGWVEFTPPPSPARVTTTAPLSLTEEQADATHTIVESFGAYKSFLLFGVTGSGKTEVYLQAIQQVIANGKQALVLVPEIGLTPQLVNRFRQRVGGRLAVLHSELAVNERHTAWAAARSGATAMILGTRSAVFTPMLNPGLIIVDEEHDLSYKQQEGLRYHARDIAVFRAKKEAIPIVLGSATPSLESIYNVSQSRYELLRLGNRPLGAHLPRINYVDLKKVPVQQGLSRTLVDAIAQRLSAKEQSLIFVNRRGYAPVLFCSSCGWQAQCERCDTKLIFHKADHALRCHHCGVETIPPEYCPACAATSIVPLGGGTQRLETHIKHIFPAANVVRIDRDSTRRKGELEKRLNQAISGEADILIGTQLLAKGHHFPMVTLVGIIDADQGLYSVDFRATEYLFQQIMQVAGRAGRASNPGQVLVQTFHPEDAHFQFLQSHDYAGFVQVALEERGLAQHPPYAYFVLLRSESTKPMQSLRFLAEVNQIATALTHGQCQTVQVMDPVPAPMEKRAGRYRAQLLISSRSRPGLHSLLDALISRMQGLDSVRRVRWSIDVDPMEMY